VKSLKFIAKSFSLREKLNFESGGLKFKDKKIWEIFFFWEGLKLIKKILFWPLATKNISKPFTS
jgi:hypothetical protein